MYIYIDRSLRRLAADVDLTASRTLQKKANILQSCVEGEDQQTHST